MFVYNSKTRAGTYIGAVQKRASFPFWMVEAMEESLLEIEDTRALQREHRLISVSYDANGILPLVPDALYISWLDEQFVDEKFASIETMMRNSGQAVMSPMNTMAGVAMGAGAQPNQIMGEPEPIGGFQPPSRSKAEKSSFGFPFEVLVIFNHDEQCVKEIISFDRQTVMTETPSIGA